LGTVLRRHDQAMVSLRPSACAALGYDARGADPIR
jgi:hypothetical protein